MFLRFRPLALVAFALLGLAVAHPAQAQLKGETRLSLQFNMTPLQINDFRDVDVSNWQVSSTDTSIPESRVRLPLGSFDPGIFAYGGGVTIEYYFIDRFSLKPRIGFTFASNSSVLTAGLGVGMVPLDRGRFSLVVTPELIYSIYGLGLGLVEDLDGYRDEVVLPETNYRRQTSINAGDSLAARFGNVGVRVGVAPTFRLSSSFSLFMDLGFEWTVPTNFELDVYSQSAAGGVSARTFRQKADPADPAFVETDGFGTQPLDPTPSVHNLGFSAMVGVIYTFSYGTEGVDEGTVR